VAAKLPAVGLVGCAALAVLSAVAGHASSATSTPTSAAMPDTTDRGQPMHPTFALLDEDGEHVLRSGAPISPMTTCGKCHDTAFIEGHSFHADVGLLEATDAGATPSGRPWDFSPGLFGRWNALTYRHPSPPGESEPGLSRASWIRFFGRRHVGGGPAMWRRAGVRLDAPRATAEAGGSRPSDDGSTRWDWSRSGVVEMNCFLCHIADPDDPARVEALEEGAFRWAATASLANTGIVVKRDGGWRWNPDAFDEQGHVAPERLRVQDPDDAACARCHGLVESDPDVPVLLSGCVPEYWGTITTGQIISRQRLSESAMNLVGKEGLSRSWDVHAERLLECVDCHHSANNPIYYAERDASRPAHLQFDARRMEIGEYLHRPSHDFAKGRSALGTLADGRDASMRRCESCHATRDTHAWLPYRARHFDALSCEACHIPRLYAPARREIDWTVITPEGKPRGECRGVSGDGVLHDGEAWGADTPIEGFEPVLLPRRDPDGRARLTPHNLISSWFWIHGDPARPVPAETLTEAFLDGGSYREDVTAVLDADGDGRIAQSELRLDTPAKVEAIRGRLIALGLDGPRIAGEIQPYAIHHGVARGEWAIRDCRTCHGAGSKLTMPFDLASHAPGEVTPAVVPDTNVELPGVIVRVASGVAYVPNSTSAGLYVLGHDHVGWANRIGALFLLAAVAGVVAHGGSRFVIHRRRRNDVAAVAGAAATSRAVYVYTAYERLWHWLQAVAILTLVASGVSIHFPDTLGVLPFDVAVRVHNIVAAVVVINALFAAFYHLASGEIRKFLPEPQDFLGRAIVLGRFYLRGIFRGEAHPFQKAPHRKLNVLQQITYLGILNVLLPVQVAAGLGIWGAQRWPELAATLGGLTFLAPLHTLGAWLFAAFLLMHVYLTTTGRTPFAYVKAMVAGWETVGDDTAPERSGTYEAAIQATDA
jgi:thiosulfate reductase cytochrome b subunit